MATRHPDDTIQLEPLAPTTTKDLWLDSRRDDDIAERTLKGDRCRVGQFTDWLTDNDIGNMNDVTARTVYLYRLDIKDGLESSTVAQRVATVRRFLRFCVSIDAVDPTIPDRIEVPSRDTNARREVLDEERAETILAYYEQFDYASKYHTLVALCWHTGFRTGTIRALDVPDIEIDKQRVKVRHRPETDTPLKNKHRGERYVALSDEMVSLLEDFIEYNRPAVTDEYDREPLFSTWFGRAGKNTLRRWFEAATKPCVYGDCPHDKSPMTCRAAQSVRYASECPSSVSGHPVRRGAITKLLREDVPPRIVSGRMNVSEEVIESNYDVRSQEEKAEQRRGYVENIW